jgi:hypothetical protein
MDLPAKAIITLLTACLALGGGAAFGQSAPAEELERATQQLNANPASAAARARLAKLYYAQGSAQAAANRHGVAVESYRAGLDIAEGQANKLRPTEPVVQVLRYGAGYSLYAGRQYEQAAAVLEPLAGDENALPKARYLLGLALERSPQPSRWLRGLELLALLAAEADPPVRDLALHTGARWATLHGLALASAGRFGEAAGLADAFLKAAPVDVLSEDEGIQHFLYAAGFFYRNAGNSAAAVYAYEKLYGLNEDYTLRNGLTLSAVLANAYYQAGLDALALDSPDRLRQAIQWFNDAEETGSVASADVNHGRAIAYMRLGPLEARNAAREIEILRQKDPAYFRLINRAR